MRQYSCAGIHLNKRMLAKEGIIFNGIQNSSQLISKEDGDNSRRRLVCTETMIVSCAGNGDTQQICIIVNRFDDSHQENQELCVFSRSTSGLQQVYTSICNHGPVVVFTGTIDTVEGFFMEQAYQTVFVSNFFHDFHLQLIVIDGNVCRVENRS